MTGDGDKTGGVVRSVLEIWGSECPYGSVPDLGDINVQCRLYGDEKRRLAKKNVETESGPRGTRRGCN